ncbi:hypothetical protein F4677DRAFT_100211 [Hypoxylon crocopeplum]|nr:hypothetical protein F4677DRAFT_100211 [Hypoxylon crocopeplum]
MSSLYIIRGPLCRPLLARPSHILKRHKFSGRIKSSDIKPELDLRSSRPARTRFAPSPTGYVHIGSLRTALYSFLVAKATGGKFILRIEDTDQARLVPDAEKRLYEDLKWAGLSWDEGPDVVSPHGRHGPYRQSERLELYKQHAEQLVSEGHAYRCFCTIKDLDQMRAASIASGIPTVYNGRCTHILPDVSAQRAADGERHCIRFKCDNRRPSVHDLVYGDYVKRDPEEDFIIMKADGYPTYHFANVVDDHLMKITHVIRGAEWLISTPRHVALYEAFGWQPPKFAHLGLLVDEAGQKLSKRHGDVDIASWRDKGILPVALLNYVLLLGWSVPKKPNEKKKEDLDMDMMVNKFNLKFTKGNVTVNEKYNHLQQLHLRRLVRSLGQEGAADFLLPTLERRIQACEAERTSEKGPTIPIGPPVPPAVDSSGSGSGISRDYIKKILDLDVGKYTFPDEYLTRIRPLVWRVHDSVYRDTFRKTMHIDQIYTAPPEPPPTELEGEGVEKRRRREELERLLVLMSRVPSRLSDLAADLRDILVDDLLLKMGPGEWTKARIEDALSPFIYSIYRVSPKSKSDPKLLTEAWGYRFLRWAMMGSQVGPALLKAMELIGREEAVRRAEKAYDIAKDIEREEETQIRWLRDPSLQEKAEDPVMRVIP